MFDGLDAELVVQGFDLLRTDAGNAEQFHQPGGNGGFQFFVVGQFAGGDQFGDFFLERLSDAFDFPQAVFRDEFVERLGQSFERAGGVGVGAGLERVLTLEFKQRADFVQNFRHAIFVHVKNMNPQNQISMFKVGNSDRISASRTGVPRRSAGIHRATGR